MINITIMAARSGHGGLYRSEGHAEDQAICTAVTAIEDCLAAILDETSGLECSMEASSGSCEIRWSYLADNDAADNAAAFAATGLRRLASAYPDQVSIKIEEGQP